MLIQAFSCPPFATNAYVVACLATRKAIAIDPAHQATELIANYASTNQLSLEKIILTHSHWDHIADVFPLKQRFGLPVFVHPQDQANLASPGADGLPLLVPITGVEDSLPLIEGQEINVGNILFKIIHTPGHSPGGVCLFCENERILFSGDTLFKGTIGNLSLPTANAEDMWASLRKLAALPPATKVYPGHGQPTTIGNESWLYNAQQIFSSY
jgi:glyoxylase-like metal-dependent hydrolase (beta-lactamase superfamily II)